MAKTLMKGNEVIGAAAIAAGCTHFFGYPITPQNEISEYLAREMPKHGGVFVQSESETAAINMVYGAAGAGARVMTSSSSPGIALKQEGISYIAGAELPCVIVNIVRAGPGLGGIQPSQSDYNQATRGGGNGDYKLLVYAPANLQEMAELVMLAFDKADYYRNPVMVIGDGMLGQMMEAVELCEGSSCKLPSKASWITTGTKGKRGPKVINSIFLDTLKLEERNIGLQEKYAAMKLHDTRYELHNMDNAEIVIAAYGTTSRIAKSAIEKLQEEGIKVGLIRPITLFPFPEEPFTNLPKTVKGVLTVEMSQGQMVDDVKISVNGRVPVEFYGRSGGVVPTPQAIVEKIKEMLGRV